MKNIGILYICTGKYKIFWQAFYESMERFFIPDYSKTYYIFTDDLKYFDKYAENPKLKLTYQQKQEWPYPTLLRFDIFKQKSHDLTTMDYLFFFNANMICVSEVSAEILPDEKQRLVVVQHPGYYNSNVASFTYDQNPLSSACIPPGEGQYYFMGGLNGGLTPYYLELINTLSKNINDDLKKGIIALWHDESHLNHYMLGKSPKILSPSYGYPEGLDLPFEKKILIRDKNKYGGHDFLRNKQFRILDKLSSYFKYLLSSVKRS